MEDFCTDKSKYNNNYIKYLGQLTLLNQLTREKFITDKENEHMKKFLINKYKVQAI